MHSDMKLRGCFYESNIYIVHILFFVYLVSTCPTDLATWMKRSQEFTCSNSTLYHCGFTGKGILKEFCFKPRLVPSTYCPAFQFGLEIVLLHWNCTYKIPKTTKYCSKNYLPEKPFRSNELYKYPVCFLGKKLDTISTKKSSTIAEFTQVSKKDSNLTTPCTPSYVSPNVTKNTEQSSNVQLTENGSENQTWIYITIISAIVALLIIALTMNIFVFCCLNRKKNKKFTSSEVQNGNRIFDIEEINEEDMYECIKELALQPPAMEEGDDDDINTDKPYDHLDSNRVIVMEGVQHSCSAL